MGWWPFERPGKFPGEPPDYYREGLKLAGQQKYHEALTSFRLALRIRPDDVEIRQQMAMIYTRIGMPGEAEKYYREAIDRGGHVPAAHYGLAFLLLHRGDRAGAAAHLRSFLSDPPSGEEAASHVEHARKTLGRLEAGEAVEDPNNGASED